MNIYQTIKKQLESGIVIHKVCFNGNHEIVDSFIDDKKAFYLEDDSYVEKISTQNDLIILGGGYVGQAVYELAIWLDIPVIVVDNRKEFANKERFPKAKRVICGDFAQVLENEKFHSNSSWLLVSSAHKHDTVCLSYVLKKKTSYIGMIGSAKKIATCYSAIKEMGFSDFDLKQVHAPVGLPIGGSTPREIAVGIIAEIMSVENKEKHIIAIPTDVLDALVSAPKKSIVATIIRSSGSSPRKEGARLVVFPNGEVVGTIGGGSMEVRAIDFAKKLIKENNKNVIKHFNLDNKEMVCGGEVDIFFEGIE